MKDTIKEQLSISMQFFHTRCHNPNTLLNTLRNLRSKSEFDLVLQIGEKCQQVLDKLEKDLDARRIPLKQLTKLREEKEQLEQNRKHLPPQQQEQLRALELDQRLLFLMPSYISVDASAYDELEYNVASELVRRTDEISEKQYRNNTMKSKFCWAKATLWLNKTCFSLYCFLPHHVIDYLPLGPKSSIWK